LKDLQDKDADVINIRKAKKYAFKLLSYRGRSEKELEDRLIRKGFSKTVASSVIEYLKKPGLIDDKAFAESLKREALTNKLLSHNGAKRFLIGRGIPRVIAEDILSNVENNDIENAKRLVDKKLRTIINYSPLNKRKKLYNLLCRRGYSSDTIRKVLKENNCNFNVDFIFCFYCWLHKIHQVYRRRNSKIPIKCSGKHKKR
jgi:regulatory protein